MRRLLLPAIVLLLIVAGCASPGLRNPFPDRPGVVARFPAVGPNGAAPPAPPPQPVEVCREISRIPCDIVHCPGPGYDFVVTQCRGAAASAGKCVATGECVIDSDETK